MWNLIQMIQMNLFTKQKQSHRLENKFMVTKGEKGEGIIGSLGLTYTHYYISNRKPTGPTV